MELLTDTVAEIRFYHPTADTSGVSAKWSKNGGADNTPQLLTPTVGYSAFRLPYQSEESDIKVTWTFTVPGSGTHTKVESYRIVTPYLTKRDVADIDPDISDEEFLRAEAAVRHIINAHTGQSFGKYTGILRVQGNGSRSLALPARLLSLTQVNGSDVLGAYDVVGDGYYINYYPWGIPPVRADFYGLHMHTGGVINNPNYVKLGEFPNNEVYEINGTWGWEQVPPAIKEAARLLFNDYACGDSTYRDRYLTSMTAADWRIQFHSGAFRQTGNVRADQLLAEYVLKRGWAVI